MAASDQVVVITGGASGIGLATALLFARHGWSVGIISRGEAGLSAAVGQIRTTGASAAYAIADVADAQALNAAAAAIAGSLGAATVWINAAGSGVFGQLEEVALDEFDRVTATTYTGTVNGVRTALAQMQPLDRGTVVNVCSAMAFRGLPGLSSYAGAKAAVRGFTESVQAELKLAGSRVRLSIVFPPAVNTPFFAHAVSYLPRPPRPAAPVYQPELVAQGIYVTAMSGRPRLSISFITVIFDLACRLVPGLIGLAVCRLGYDGQMTDLPAAAAQRDPCLFAPTNRVIGARGPFPARGHSSQLWLCQQRMRLAARFSRLCSLLSGDSRRPQQQFRRTPDLPREIEVEREPVG